MGTSFYWNRHRVLLIPSAECSLRSLPRTLHFQVELCNIFCCTFVLLRIRLYTMHIYHTFVIYLYTSHGAWDQCLSQTGINNTWHLDQKELRSMTKLSVWPVCCKHASELHQLALIANTLFQLYVKVDIKPYKIRGSDLGPKSVSVAPNWTNLGF